MCGFEAASTRALTLATPAGNFTGAEGVADVLRWRPEAKDAWSLKFVPDALFKAAGTQAITFEAHMFGVWVPDFWCAACAVPRGVADIDKGSGKHGPQAEVPLRLSLPAVQSVAHIM
jgi:hypothetical protein